MKISTKELSLVAMFASLTALGAFISLPLGPVPITLQSFFVILSGIILGGKLGALSQIVYIALGLVGIPIFAGFTGGLQTIIKPSFGFIIGFIFASFIVGKISNYKKSPSSKRIFLACLAGTITIYFFGLPYMYYILNIFMGKTFTFIQVFNLGCLLFLPGDLVKLILAWIIGTKILKSLNKARLSLN